MTTLDEEGEIVLELYGIFARVRSFIRFINLFSFFSLLFLSVSLTHTHTHTYPVVASSEKVEGFTKYFFRDDSG